MTLNDLLRLRGFDPTTVLVLRHRPFEPRFRRVLPWLAGNRHDLYNAYQRSHGPRVEKALQSASYVASFIGHEPQRALFIGLYARGAAEQLTKRQFWDDPANAQLGQLGMNGFSPDDPRETILRFELDRTDFYAEWAGKLIVRWPGLERSWWRWSDRNNIAVHAIPEESLLDPRMPPWDELSLGWEQLSALPQAWRSALAQWRGIYLIFDRSDGQRYVGSAYGEENLLGRWLDYAASGHGGNRLLRDRDPREFQFSILQRVSPDLSPEEVVQLETNWKERLHTRAPFGLNDN